MTARYSTILQELTSKSNKRVLPGEFAAGMINLSSNDYLGLAADVNIRDEFEHDCEDKKLSFTSSSSRLLTGNSPEYAKLESLIATSFGREACLLFNSGYHANIGILPALVQKGDLILADKLVHASIIDGIRLSQCEFRRFNHNDYDHLESILATSRDKYDHVFVVSESIYSMDGDVADIRRLVDVKGKFNVILYVDEAHAIGVRGEHGLGVSEEIGCIKEIDLIVGTFGKALASQGAYLVCDELIKQFLVNTSRSLIFTTALPPINLAWTRFVFEKMLVMNSARKHLNDISLYLSKALNAPSKSHIVPYILGENEHAVAFSKHLLDNGFLVLPIRHPTVPLGTARLRFSLQASLSGEDVKKLVDMMKDSNLR